jgi:hypothetical protein
MRRSSPIGSLSGNNPLPHPHRANDNSQSVLTFSPNVILLHFLCGMIFSENRYPLFRIMF